MWNFQEARIDVLERENENLREELQEQIFCYDSARNEVDELLSQNEKLKEKLDIVVKALEFYEKPFCQFNPEYNIVTHHKLAEETLKEVKKMSKIDNALGSYAHSLYYGGHEIEGSGFRFKDCKFFEITDKDIQESFDNVERVYKAMIEFKKKLKENN